MEGEGRRRTKRMGREGRREFRGRMEEKETCEKDIIFFLN